jgi:hypothetical protein
MAHGPRDLSGIVDFRGRSRKVRRIERSHGRPEIDLALSEGRVWQAEAKNLNLLSLYTIRFEKNMAELRLQAERKAALEQAIEEAALLSHMAKTKGETYNMAEAFTRRNFEFSTEEIHRIVNRWRRLLEAKKFAAASRKGIRIAAWPVRRASGRSSALVSRQPQPLPNVL